MWEGSGNQERGVDRKCGHALIEVDPVYFRPTEVDTLLGDPTKAKERLGWTHKTTFDQLVNEMVDADLQIAGDVTQRRLIDEQLRQAQNMEAVEEARSLLERTRRLIQFGQH